jgi:hypothetical protein
MSLAQELAHKQGLAADTEAFSQEGSEMLPPWCSRSVRRPETLLARMRPA